MTLPQDNPFETGMHPKLLHPDQPADMLANGLVFTSPFHEVKETSCNAVPQWDPGPLARLCLKCPIVGIPSVGDDCDRCGALTSIRDSLINEAQQIVTAPWSGGTLVGVLLRDGSIAPVEDRLGAGLLSSLSQDWTWLNAVETMPMLGRGASGPSAVALTSDGNAIADRMFLQGHRGFGEQDRLLDRLPMAEASSTAGETAPPPRREATGVYARSAGRVYVIGGNDPDTNEARRDIWWRDVAGGPWYEVPDGDYQPAKVLAATRPYRDGKLWILDEVRSGWLRFGRLVRLNPGTGEAEVLGKWPRIGLFDQHWLILDLEGNVVVAASSSRMKRHALIRIRLDGSKPHVDRVHVGQGELAMAPWVDAGGYALPIAREGKLPKILRYESLAGRKGAWSDMQGCL